MRLFGFIIIILINASCYSSDLRSGYWLPEDYVKYSIENPFGNSTAFISPVHCIRIENDSIFIKTYGGEFYYVITEEVGGRIELTNLKYLFNLNYFDEREVQQKKYYISKKQDYIIIEIESQEEKKTIKFINHIGDFYFSTPDDVSFKIKINGHYTLSSQPDTIKFSLNGQVKSKWSEYKLIRYTTSNKSGKSFYIISLSEESGNENEYAVQISKEEALLFEFSVIGQSNFEISVADQPKYTLKRYILKK